jgi:3-phenylpropionate/trans-cinnamate dioxygenase ferredoxin component
MSWVRTAKLDDIPVGATRVVEVDDESLLLCRTAADAIHAVENCCSHDDGPLGEGLLDGTVIQCPRHGARFDVTSGAVLRMPAAASIETYLTRITPDGWVEVEEEEE